MNKAIQFDRNGETGNIFYILGQARKVLLEQGRENDAVEMFERVKQGDYENALKLIGEYVELQDIIRMFRVSGSATSLFKRRKN